MLVAALLLAVPGTASAGKTYVVQKGDSLWGIAKKHNVTVTALRKKNGLKKGATIRPKQELEIPGTSDSKSRRKDRKKDDAKDDERSKTHWVLRKPPRKTQTQKNPGDRGGVNPCLTKDPGWGVYDRWDRGPSIGQMIMPERGGTTRSGRFDVMIHFHGHEPVRKEWVKVMKGPVLVGIDLGIGSGPYEATFRSEAVFKRLIDSIEAAVAKHTGKKRARVRKVGLSAWSAGYGAVGSILRTNYGRSLVDSVVLLDGLHAGYGKDLLNEAQMEPFTRFARDASRRRKFMFVSHSSIIPPGYASTTETANYLIWKVGGKPRKVRPRGSDPMGLDLIARYTRGNFHVRGYRGNDKMDHCAHIGLFKDVLKVHIRRRWNSPRGYRRK